LSRRRGGERGAVLPLVALVMVSLIAFTSMAIDLGYQRVARRDMQALADVVALDLARRLDGSTAGSLQSTMDAELALSLARNTTRTIGGVAPTVTYELGTVSVSGAANVFTVVGNNVVPDAVRVTARTTVDYFFRPGTGTTTRTAVASTNPSACFTMGSYALNLDSANSALLNTLIGGALNLSAISYTGLASSNLGLLGLATQLGLGGVDELATTNTSLGTLFLAAANVAQANGDAANANLLQSLSTQAPNSTVNLGTLFGLSSGGATSGATTSVNALDLVAGSAFIANGQSAVSVPGLTVALTPVMNLTSSVTLVQKAVAVCGHEGATKSTSQASISVTGSVISMTVPIAGLGSVTVDVGSVANPVSVTAAVAGASATLQNIICGTRNGVGTVGHPNGIDVGLLTALLQANASVPVRIRGDLAIAGILGLVRVDISTTYAAATNPLPGSPPTTGGSTISFRQAPDAIPSTKSSGTGPIGLGGLAFQPTSTSVSARLVLGLINVGLTSTQLDSILNPVLTSVVNPIITQINTSLMGPLANLLGLTIAGADIRWDSIACDSPALDA
jgi:uncharacterized membrane protein